MRTLARRFLVLTALLFWQGGFTFYGAVVIPIGLRELGRLQTRVTGPVTWWLNVAGLIALVIFAWDLFPRRDRTGWRRAVGRVAWLGMAVALVVLFILHSLLIQQVEAGTSSSDGHFQALHRAYLWVGTAQWVCALVYTGMTLAAWRREDQQQVGG
jgi:hypothetical protein